LSLILVAAVGPNKKFVDVLVGFPGSVNDGRIWTNSGLNARLEALLSQLPSTPVDTKAAPGGESRIERVPAFLLGDSAYPDRKRTVSIFKLTESQKCPITKSLNTQLAGVRYCVENAFGILKGRFRILGRPLECATEDIRRTCLLITSLFTLHNYLIDEADDTVIEQIARGPNEIRDDEHEENGNNNANQTVTRNILWRHRCWYEEEG
jgi:hypothetical protein